jgi:CCR4-NOT transcription complex subunit 7/8
LEAAQFDTDFPETIAWSINIVALVSELGVVVNLQPDRGAAMNFAGAFYPSQSLPFAMPLYSPDFGYAPVPMLPPPPPGVPVRAVWADNLDAELNALSFFAERTRCVAVTLHYPGVIHGADARDPNLLTADERYAILNENVDALKPLQVGLAILTHEDCLAAWEFNLSDFHPDVDPCAARSVAYLTGRGLNADEHSQNGFPVARLTTALRSCGLIGRRGVSWITYTGAYHVAYLVKIVTGGNQLPDNLAGFVATVRWCLGEDVYDVARLARDSPDVPVGLERIANTFGLRKPLLSPQLAGTGSVHALEAFMILRSRVFHGNVTEYRGVLYGLHAL